jgi:hypothetical protein
VIKFVFAEHGKSGKASRAGNACPRDYWQRFLDVAELGEAERDQATLRVMLGSDDVALLDMVMDADARPR